MLLPFLAPLVLGRVGPIPFVRAVRGAEAIVIGQVAEVTTIAGHRFAELRVERTLKGTPVPTLRFLAEATWACDRSTARAGERGMFLVGTLRPKRWGDGSPTRLAAIQQARAQGPVFALVGAGAGRIVFGGEFRTPGLLGNSWYLGRLIMPHAVPPQKDPGGRPYYGEDRLAYAVERCLKER